jgi:WD40 repeat protein
VDVDTITDPVERMSTIAQILNFGQTPTQLFDKPHPRREVGASSALAPQLCTDPSSVETTAVRDLWRLGEGPVRDVRVGQDGKVMVVCGERLLCLPGMQECFTWGNQDGTMRFVALQRPGSSVKKTESEKLLARSVVCYESLHQGFVSVAASSEDGSILVTGSSLGDMSVWRPELRVNASAVGRAAGIQVVRGTEKTVRSLQLRTRLCAHTGAVTCLTVSNTHAVMISGSVDGTVILWDVRRLRFMRQLISNLAAAPVCVDLNLTGSMVVVAAGREIRVVNINGSLLAHVVMDAAQGDRVVSARAIRVSCPLYSCKHARR